MDYFVLPNTRLFKLGYYKLGMSDSRVERKKNTSSDTFEMRFGAFRDPDSKASIAKEMFHKRADALTKAEKEKFNQELEKRGLKDKKDDEKS